MKNPLIPRTPTLFICMLIFIGAGGCVPPDRWSVFKPDFQKIINESKEPSVKVPEQLQPDVGEPVEALPEKKGPLELSIEEAVMLALKHNRELEVEQLNPVIAGTFEQIERGIYNPEWFGEFEYFEEQATETARSTGTRFSVDGRDTTSVSGIRQFLPSGTSIETSIAHERSISNRTPEQQVGRLGMDITQALLQGFGPAVNLASVRQAELETLASIYQLRGFTEALLAETETAYWNYVLAKREIDIFENSLALARKQRDEVEERIAVGLLPEIEAAATRAEVALREQALINARSLAVDNRLRLLRLINPPGSGDDLDRLLNATSELQNTSRPITDIEERLSLALRSRPDLGEARLRVQQNQLETIVTRNGLLPRLDFFIAMGRTGYADTFTDSFRELDRNTYDFSAGIRLNHFLGNRSAKARHLAARTSVSQAEAALSNLKQLVRLDVRLAVNEAERARQQITASAATRRFREETARAEQERFAVGAGTSLQVAQAQRDLVASQIAEVEAIVHYRIALIELYLSEGSLMERRGVRFASDLPTL